jgi:MoaA/NifB/PqqE/SkfB family radical SAM enzyme
MEDVVSKYEQYFKGAPGFSCPRRITVEISSRCNLSCAMCPRNHLKDHSHFRGGDMDFPLFKKIIDEISGFPERTLVPFFRGESLMNGKFCEMILYAVTRGVAPIQLATNALLLTDSISRIIIGAGVDFVSFSLDAVDGEGYQKMRNSSEYQKALDNILRFLEIRDLQERKKPVVQISAVKTKDNEKSMPEFIGSWLSRAERVRVYPEHSQEGKFGSLKGSRKESVRRPCLKPLTDFVVYWNGEAGLCNHDWEGKEGLGNMKEKSIREIWESVSYRKIREEHFRNKVPERSACYFCDHWKAYYSEKNIVGELYEK